MFIGETPPTSFEAALRLLRPINNAVSTVIERGTPARTVEDRAESLQRLMLDEELTNAFRPPLKQLGYEIDNEDILDQFGTSRTVSVVTSQERRFYVVCIPKAVLEQAQEANLGAFSLISYLFARDSRLYIISRDVSVMDLSFEAMVDRWRESLNIDAVFVAWSHIMKLLGEKKEEARVIWLRQMLKLDQRPAVAQRPPSLAATALSPQEKGDIVKLLSQLASNPFDTPQDYLQALVAAAQLPNPGRFAGHWNGDPNHDALLLVDSTENPREFPIGHLRAGENKLGCLLKALLDQDLSPNDARTVVRIILDHHLIRDPETANALQVKYSPDLNQGLSG